MAVIEQIDRFKIIREIESGPGSVAYLAEDPLLLRNVAIKTVAHSLSPEQGSYLMEEARIVSKLKHPNIVSVYEVGNFEGKPYVVFEYVEGKSLRDIMKREKLIVVPKAVSLMIQILDGIAYGHQMGVIHGDLNPSNIIIDYNGIPRIMDFGLSSIIGRRYWDGQLYVAGIPNYIAPEHFFKTALTPQTDIFFIGSLFYEMVVGHPAFSGTDLSSLMYRTAHDAPDPPSHHNKLINHNIDRIIMKAMEKNPQDRYPEALVIKNLLENYLNPSDQHDAIGQVHGTVDFIMRRMRLKGDLPAFSGNIIEISSKLSSLTAINFSSAGDLAKIILRDFSLTNKLLKIVNSALYANRSGKVSTISKAVLLLGVEKVRMMAASLMIFDHLQNKSQAIELKEEALQSFMSGLVAIGVAENLKLSGKEEIFICAMLHNLGKMLVICYFPEEYEEIKNRKLQMGLDDTRASKSVLGITYKTLGMEVSRSWNFPEKIVRSMEDVSPSIIEQPKTEYANLQILSSYSNELLHLVMNTPEDDRPAALSDMSKRYQNSIAIPDEQMESLIESAVTKSSTYNDIVQIDRQTSTLIKKMFKAGPKQVSEAQEAKSAGQSQRTLPAAEHAPEPARPVVALTSQQIHIFADALHEINDVMAGSANLSDVIYMILETMYRGLEFNRVIFCMRDVKQARMVARFGLGENIDEIVKHFQFRISPSPDIFNIAISRERGIIIDNASAPTIIRNIPEWYRNIIAAQSFLVYPLIAAEGCIGLFYADKKEEGTMLNDYQKNFMETLRDIAIQAMTRKHK